jgi:hypothetical protein
MQDWFIGGAAAQLSEEERRAAERNGRALPFDAVLDQVLGTQAAART